MSVKTLINIWNLSMILKFNHEKCSGCGVCELVCSIRNFKEGSFEKGDTFLK